MVYVLLIAVVINILFTYFVYKTLLNKVCHNYDMTDAILNYIGIVRGDLLYLKDNLVYKKELNQVSTDIKKKVKKEVKKKWKRF